MQTFEIYCGANNGVSGIKGSKKSEAMQGANVVHELLRGLENKGHMVIMNNFILSDTVWADRIGLPMALATNFIYTKCIQCHLKWRMHKFKQFSIIVWVDKKPDFIIFIVVSSIDSAKWDICERRLRHLPRSSDTLSSCERWMLRPTQE